MILVHKKVDGKVSITHILVKLDDQQLVEHIAKLEADDQEIISTRILEDESLLPSDRHFRNAWTDDLDTNTVDIDINKAKEIQKDVLRQLRAPKLTALDVEVMKAIEQGNNDKVAELAAVKQQLRDVTKLALPNDVEELKAFIPDCLK
jgi:hypothetical protein